MHVLYIIIIVNLFPVVHSFIAHLNAGRCVAQPANCYSGGECRDTPISFGTIEQCCNTPDILRSFNIPGTETCEECRCKYIVI